MLYLVSEMALLLLAALLLGVLIAWLVWGRQAKTGDARAVETNVGGVKVSSDLRAERSRAATLQQRCDEKDREILKLKSQLEASLTAETGLAVTRGRLGAEAEEALAQGDMSAALEAENARLRGRIGELNAQVREHQNQSEQLASLEKARAHAESEAEELRAALSEARAQEAAHGSSAADDQRVALEAEVNRLKTEMTALTAQLQGDGDEHALATRMSALKQERDQARHDMQGLRATIADLEARRARRRALDGDKDAEIIRLRSLLVPHPPSNQQNALNGGGETSEQRDAGQADAASPEAASPEAASPEAARPEAARPDMLRPEQPFGEPDDLKIISGIGPKLQQALNAQGIYHFWQIAALSEEQLAWLDENMLSFKGRIKREGWIEQAQAKHQEVYGEDYKAAMLRALGS